MDLGSRIARWRVAKGLSRQDLARSVGVSAAAVYQWEGSGAKQTSPSVAHLEQIVRALGMTMAEFYGRTPPRKREAA
jgi:transcriptional regulator with XRE-family HTH domain